MPAAQYPRVKTAYGQVDEKMALPSGLTLLICAWFIVTTPWGLKTEDGRLDAIPADFPAESVIVRS
jgi:hypothetical protein